MARNGSQQNIRRVNGVPHPATDYISPSRLKLWLRCPAAYKRRYVDGIITPTSPNLFLGKAVHRGLEVYYRYRQKGVWLFPDYVGECVKAYWALAAEGECISFQTSDDERRLQAQAVDLVTAYLAQVPKDEGEPIVVEQRLEAPLIDPQTGEDFGVSLVGILDLVLDNDQGPIIVDFKTAARSSQADLIHEVQLSCYSYLFRHASATREAGLEVRSLIKTKTPKVEVHRYEPRQGRHYDRLFDVIRAFLDGVNSNRFHIRPGVECSFCDFREMCTGDGGSS